MPASACSASGQKSSGVSAAASKCCCLRPIKAEPLRFQAVLSGGGTRPFSSAVLPVSGLRRGPLAGQGAFRREIFLLEKTVLRGKSVLSDSAQPGPSISWVMGLP